MPMLSSTTLLRRATAAAGRLQSIRCISTLPSNPHIHVFPDPESPSTSHILTLLPTSPPSKSLAIGSTSKLPPTPDSLIENPRFLTILQDVLRSHATADPWVQAQAAAFASTSGSALGSGGGRFFSPAAKKHSSGAGGASDQGGAGGGGRGGWIHVSDSRAPPDYGRIAFPEDIFGSLEVDGQGRFVRSEGLELGNYQSSGTYRVVTREGILGLSDFLRGKLVERLRAEEEKEKKK